MCGCFRDQWTGHPGGDDGSEEEISLDDLRREGEHKRKRGEDRGGETGMPDRRETEDARADKQTDAHIEKPSPKIPDDQSGSMVRMPRIFESLAEIEKPPPRQ